MKNFICVILFIFCFCKCHKKDPDPCASMHPTTAGFKIMEYIDNGSRNINHGYNEFAGWTNYETDTALFTSLRLEALQDSTSNTKYEWTIGKTKVYRKAFDIGFYDRPIGNNTIPISLKVTRDPDKNCFPRDSGIAIYTKTLTLVGPNKNTPCIFFQCDEYNKNALTNGTYIGDFSDFVYKEWGSVTQEKAEGKTFSNDTLVVKLGYSKDSSNLNYGGNLNFFHFTDFKRKDVNKQWEYLFAFSHAVYGYKQINEMQYGSFYLSSDNNTISCKVNGKTYFKGKRL